MTVVGGALRGRNRPTWNGYQRDENTEKAADWIKPHHGLCFSPDRAQAPTSSPAQSDTPAGVRRRNQFPALSFIGEEIPHPWRIFSDRNCGGGVYPCSEEAW